MAATQCDSCRAPLVSTPNQLRWLHAHAVELAHTAARAPPNALRQCRGTTSPPIQRNSCRALRGSTRRPAGLTPARTASLGSTCRLPVMSAYPPLRGACCRCVCAGPCRNVPSVLGCPSVCASLWDSVLLVSAVLASLTAQSPGVDVCWCQTAAGVNVAGCPLSSLASAC